MRKVGLNALALGALVAVSAGAGGGAGCSGTKPTELVPGVMSQIVVPRDLQGVRVTVLADGALVFDQGYNVGPGGTVQLPSTLGVLSSPNPSTSVSVTIRGYQQPCVGTGNSVSDDCSNLGDAPVGNGGPQVLRRSVQTFVDQHILFVPMPLSYSCWNNGGCGSGQSCKGNQCVTSTTDSTSLVDFDPSLLDGTDVCFNPQLCFPTVGTFTAQLVDQASCTYAYPVPPAEAADGGASLLNVRVWYDDFLWTYQGSGGDAGGPPIFANVLQNAGEEEILNLDPTEGFTLGGVIPDAGTIGDAGPHVSYSQSQLFQLSPGLCALAQAASYPPPPPVLGEDGGIVSADGGTGEYVTISHIDVATGCPPKPPLLPICAGQVPNGSTLPGDAGTVQMTSNGLVCNAPAAMTPTQSALYLAFDDSESMNGAYGASGSATALSLSLDNPVFKRTYAASTFLHQTTSADCTAMKTSFLTPQIAFGLAGDVQVPIADELRTWMAPDGITTCGPASNTGPNCAAPLSCVQTGGPGVETCVDPLDLQAALRLDSGAYRDILDFLQGRGSVNVAAAMFFLNRAPSSSNDCQPPLAASDGGVSTSVTQTILGEIAAAYNNTPSIKTYFIVLDDNAHDTHDPGGALTYFNSLQAALPQAITVLDATNTSTMSEAQTVGANFSKIVEQLGTCLYDYGLPAGDNLDELQVSYTIPGQPRTIIPADPNCNEANQDTVSGWNIDSGRVRICGQACSTLQTSILGATAAAVQANLPAPDIAVTATVLCSPTAEETDAGPEDAAAASDGESPAFETCVLTCTGCCDSFGTCFESSQLTCGTGGELCVQCTGTQTCGDAGTCEGPVSSAGGSSGSSSDGG